MESEWCDEVSDWLPHQGFEVRLVCRYRAPHEGRKHSWQLRRPEGHVLVSRMAVGDGYVFKVGGQLPDE